ncbi:MAG: hypothetical protein U1E53_31945 [Dongiaceae bacterium]
MRTALALPAILALGLLATAARAEDAAQQAVYARGFAFGLLGHHGALLGRPDFASDADYAAYLAGIRDGYARFTAGKPMDAGKPGDPTNCGT